MAVRLTQHEASALRIARWLADQPGVARVLHPALPSCPGHDTFVRDFKGASGLFSFVLDGGDEAARAALIDGLEHFGIGYSWGGFESLALPVDPAPLSHRHARATTPARSSASRSGWRTPTTSSPTSTAASTASATPAASCCARATRRARKSARRHAYHLVQRSTRWHATRARTSRLAQTMRRAPACRRGHRPLKGDTMRFTTFLLAGTMLAAATPAFAQEATDPPKADHRQRLRRRSSATIASAACRSRIENLAVQGGITISHESGFYIGTWGSNLAGWGTFGGAEHGAGPDRGLQAAGRRRRRSTSAPPGTCIRAASTTPTSSSPMPSSRAPSGPVNLTAGVAYAPKQQALGPCSSNGALGRGRRLRQRGRRRTTTSISGATPAAACRTPALTLKGHLGYSNGNKGLGPFATSVAPTGEYFDWLVGADFTIPSTPLTLGVAYVDTDIAKRESAYLQPSFSKGQDGTGSIADAKVVVSLTAAF